MEEKYEQNCVRKNYKEFMQKVEKDEDGDINRGQEALYVM